MTTINFRHGSLIRTGPQLIYGGKWNATLDDDTADSRTNAELTISINIYFKQIDPASGATGRYPDTDDGTTDAAGNVISSKRKIQKWAPGEFMAFKYKLLTGAQKFWSGVFWLQTPSTYRDLDVPEDKPTHRSNIYCKLELEEANAEATAHYTIAVVRVSDDDNFRSNSVLYSQRDIQSESMIPRSTTKFWTHFHEVGHLIGLGHVGWAGHHNLSNNNNPKAYGVTMRDKQDVMGMGSQKHHWQAKPWQEGAAALTGTRVKDWQAHMHHILPTPLPHR